MQIGPAAGERRRELCFAVLLGVVTLVWMVFLVPPPEIFILDYDQGVQMAGAQQIAFGQAPFVDWHSTYGPLVYYASYIALKAGGGRVFGEIILCIAGFTTGYVLIYQGTRWLTGKCWIGALVTLLALVGFSRFYKYYILVCPLAVLGACYLYLVRPTLSRAIALAGAVVIAGLFRPDFGYYSMLAAGLAVIVGRSSCRVRHLLALGTGLLVWSSPWWGYLLWRGGGIGLWTYVYESSVGAANHAQGLGQPVPTLRLAEALWTPHNLTAIGYLAWVAVLMVAAGMVIRVGLQRGWRRRRLRWMMAVVTVVFAACCLMQAMHRADLSHLMQAVSVSYVLLGWVISELARRSSTSPAIWTCILRGAVATAMILVWIALSGQSGGIAQFNVNAPRELARDYTRRPADLIRGLRRRYPNHGQIALVDAVQAVVPRDQPILVVPYVCTLYTLTSRPFAAGQMFVAPGFFNSDADQEITTQRLRAEGYPSVVEYTVGAFDGLPEHSLERFSAKLMEFIRQEYQPSSYPGIPASYRIWVKKGSRTGDDHRG